MMKMMCKAAIVAATLTLGQSVNAATVFFGDAQGNVGQHDTVSGVTSAVGSFTGQIGQIIGLAYDAVRNVIIATDRSAGRVLAMDPGTGATSELFSGAGANNFQGAAVIGDTLYGIDEGTQTLETFDLLTNTFTGAGTGAFSGHSHALGVNSATGQLITSNNGSIVEATLTGNGAILAPYSGSFLEDVEAFEGNFLGAVFTSGEGLVLIDGVTGATSSFLTAAQIDGAGVTGSMSGVALQTTPVPVPASLPLLMAGLAGFGFLRRRRR